MEGKLPKRDEVPVELTWRLEDIYDKLVEQGFKVFFALKIAFCK